MSEQSICQARASVMVYDDTSKKWVPIKPGQQGFSRINIYHNTANNTFRVVGVKLQDQQVVINYSIVKGLKYNQATPTFHQWRDARQVYGLNFASKEEATTFSTAMMFALNTLSSQDGGPAVQRQNGPSSEDPDVPRRQMMEPHQMQGVVHKERERRTSGSGPVSLPAVLAVAPPVAPPAPMAPMAPPPPPGPPPPATVPPPMPPPLPVGGGHGGPHLEGAGNELAQPLSGLAAALAGAKLRKVARDENSPPGTSVAKNDGNRSSGGEGLMQEMNALLARRRKASEKPEEEDPKPGQNSTDAGKNPWDRANSVDKASLVSRVRPVGSTSEGDLDFDRMKQEILDEVVRELQKVKDEIINAIRQEIGRIHTC
ncbi:ena/VASP-like protein isoform X2 [Oncorhynchus tshawytscha]|uniref:ena/VASP-like protein isoform X2 n=1 Tax=Oncorhynchus tshawytscha TaxID=74940 RepID=UPI001C3C8246|nr:ena/VASP-like protein isoform X2 [Oncorhynchus tshawytscha]